MTAGAPVPSFVHEVILGVNAADICQTCQKDTKSVLPHHTQTYSDFSGLLEQERESTSKVLLLPHRNNCFGVLNSLFVKRNPDNTPTKGFENHMKPVPALS